MCDYQGYEFGAGYYPDSICIDGYLYDTDDCDNEGRINMKEDEVKIPCPKCNTEEAKEYVKENKND